MKRFLALMIALVAFQGFAFAQTADFKLKQFYPSDFNQWTAVGTNTIASGAKTVTLSAPTSRITANGGAQFNPFVVNNTILVDKGTSVEETVTITAASCTPPTSCSFTATFNNAHTSRYNLNSGTFGLQEAVNAAYNAGAGTVFVEPTWPGTTAQIVAVTGGLQTVLIIDRRGGAWQSYTWSGSAYGANFITGLNSVTSGAEVRILAKSVTVAGAASATITATNFIPAGSIVLGVTSYVTSTFSNTSLTSMKIGDGTTTNKFSSSTMALIAGTTSNSLTDGAAATAPLLYQAATSVVITGNGASFTTNGIIRLVLFYIQVTPPTA